MKIGKKGGCFRMFLVLYGIDARPATHQRAGGRSATGEVLRVVPGRAGWDALRSAGALMGYAERPTFFHTVSTCLNRLHPGCTWFHGRQFQTIKDKVGPF